MKKPNSKGSRSYLPSESHVKSATEHDPDASESGCDSLAYMTGQPCAAANAWDL